MGGATATPGNACKFIFTLDLCVYMYLHVLVILIMFRSSCIEYIDIAAFIHCMLYKIQ